MSFFFSILMGLLFIGPIVHLKIEKKKKFLITKLKYINLSYH